METRDAGATRGHRVVIQRVKCANRYISITGSRGHGIKEGGWQNGSVQGDIRIAIAAKAMYDKQIQYISAVLSWHNRLSKINQKATGPALRSKSSTAQRLNSGQQRPIQKRGTVSDRTWIVYISGESGSTVPIVDIPEECVQQETPIHTARPLGGSY